MALVIILSLLFCAWQTSGYSIDTTNKLPQDMAENILTLLLKLQKEEFYDTVLIYGKDCIFHYLFRKLEVPFVLLSSGTSNFDWNYSSLALILICGPEDDQEMINRTLIQLQRNRRLIYLEENIEPEPVCRNYWTKDQYNIALLKGNFNVSKIIYTCRYYEDLKVKEISLSKIKEIYVEQFRNIFGETIRAVTDGVAPRSMSYWEAKSGKVKTIGFVANLVTSFAQRINASIEIRNLTDGRRDLREIIKLAAAEELDIGITLDSSLSKTFDTASFPFILTRYCVMLQVPEALPYNMVYAMIVDRLVLAIIFILLCLLSILLIYSRTMSSKHLSLVNVFLNDKTFRGLLGQTFPFPANASKPSKFLFIILCFASIMFTTMYDAYLQSYFTHPPYGPRIRTFKDFEKFQRTLALSKPEHKILAAMNSSRFHELRHQDVEILHDWREYIRMRDSFNTTYCYPVSEFRWSSLSEQQKLFKEPVFYFERDLCFSNLMFMSIPLRPHLPYRHLFEQHIQSQHEFGLVSYWKGRSFFDMVALGLTSLEDLSQPKFYSPALSMEDISWIVKAYLVAISLSILCFLWEVISTTKGCIRLKKSAETN
ncbi:hypothetical protein KR018_010371 [Drosophila ironensis]|nr:hypothetical protein KR018_010371 [Drosophila ironensis]